jgi:acyl-coenzyme A thioesterase 9
MPMRVKTPWIEALTQIREAQKAGPQENAGQSVKRDLSPKKMSDSYYSAVRMIFCIGGKSVC